MTRDSAKTKSNTNAPAGEGPPFRRIESDLRVRLRRGEWKDGALLPSRRALASEYGVALRTMERAISSLLTEGLLRADGRWGTYAGGAKRTASPADLDPGPVVTRPELIKAATLGLLDTNSLETHAPRRDEYGWLDVIATHAERSFAGAGGTTRYFSHFGAGPGRITVSRAVDVLREEGADALLVTGIFDDPTIIQEVVAALENCPIPAVYVSWDDVSGRVPLVFYDNRIAGGQAAQHLYRCGYSDLVFFAPFQAPWAEQRLEGMRQMSTGDIRVVPTLRSPEAHIADWDICRAQANLLLEQCSARCRTLPPVGIVAAQDTLALTILDAALERGLTPGKDFGLVGFDDQPLSRARGLTTLHPPLEALGEQAARMLLSRLHGDGLQMQMRLRSHLVPRSTTLLRPIS
jgi:DNA-binding LacI/PurR family transcriptional regulator